MKRLITIFLLFFCINFTTKEITPKQSEELFTIGRFIIYQKEDMFRAYLPENGESSMYHIKAINAILEIS